jgi:ABC-2 type transport system permease protein
MRAQIAAELLKMRTTRALYVAVGVIALLTVGLSVAAAALAGHGTTPQLRPGDLAAALRGPVRLAGGAMLLVGLLASAGEFRHRTILTTRLAQPRAGRVFLAKLTAAGALGVVVGAGLVVASLASSGVLFHSKGIAFEPLSHGVPQTALVVPVVIALHALLGVAIGALLRSTAAAVGVTMGWAFLVEGILPVITRHHGIVDWLPTGLVGEVMQTHPAAGQLAAPAAAAVLLGYVAVLVAVTAAVDRVRAL